MVTCIVLFLFFHFNNDLFEYTLFNHLSRIKGVSFEGQSNQKYECMKVLKFVHSVNATV